MAKKEEGLKYLQMPLPQARAAYKSVKLNWSGLNLSDDHDTGELSMEHNISTELAPYLAPSQLPYDMFALQDPDYVPLSMYGFDDYLIIVYSDNYRIYAKYVKTNSTNSVAPDTDCFICRLNPDVADINDAYERNIVQFNVYDSPTDVIGGGYVKKLLVFPDRVSMPVMSDIVMINGTYPDDAPTGPDTGKLYCFRNSGGKKYYRYDGTAWSQSGSAGYFAPDKMTVNIKTFADTEDHLPPETASTRYYWKNLTTNNIYEWVDDDADSENSGWKITSVPAMPPIKYACVHLSRLFGVDDSRVYASGFNDYANWNLDTIDEISESNAWCSPAQSNVKADGVFTGITTFENHVICFKRDFMHEIYNTKNPFRIQDIYEEGAIDNRTIQNVDGKLIFVSPDGVKLYTGGNPRVISEKLDIKEYVYAVSGTDGRNYYLYCDDDNAVSPVRRMLTFDTYIGEWSEQSVSSRVKSFASTKTGTYILCETSGSVAYPKLYKLNSGVYASQNWSFETDLMTRQNAPTVNIKHIKKIQLLADIKSGARIKVYALYDGESFNQNTSQLLYDSGVAASDKTVPIRVKARKSAHYSLKLHFEGTGFVKLYEMELFFEQGGDLYVP